MKKIIRSLLGIAAIGAAATLAGCAATSAPAMMLFDLGTLSAAQEAALTSRLPPISIAEVAAPAALDTQMMFYRLAYANDQQPRPYASSRWSAPPAQLFGQRLKARIAQAGGIVLSASDGATNVLLLRIDMDEFAQHFSSPAQSAAKIAMRASVFDGRTLVAQKTFTRQVPAPFANAAGGARALVQASDAVISDMMAWLAGLPRTM